MSYRKFWPFAISYSLLAFSFSLYSYSQVDLNLTLSGNQTYQVIQQQLIHLGYFNRPLSTIIFFTILGLLITNYGLLITYYERWQLTSRQIWYLVLATSILLLFSYPALAHDIFNYMFDARILVKYQANPWTMTPLDFPTDEWTRFMRWTHVPSIYPPGWIVTTLPFYLLGLGKFTLTLLSFKILGLLSFLSSCWLILKLAGKKAWILWSFNPMVLIESLSSVHNDITMLTFTLLAFYLFTKITKRTVLTRTVLFAYLSLIWGGLVKYLSFLLIPFLKSPKWAAVVAWVGSGGVMLIREINPWYILLPVSLSIMSKNDKLTKLAILSSLLVMYRYYPCVAIFSC